MNMLRLMVRLGSLLLAAYPRLLAISAVSISPFLLLLLGNSIFPACTSVSLPGERWAGLQQSAGTTYEKSC